MSKDSATLILSNLAGQVNVPLSSADTAQEMSDKILARFKDASPLSLSQKECEYLGKARELRIDLAVQNGLAPAIGNKLKLEFCGEALELSNGIDGFEQVMEFASLIQDQKLLELSEKTAAQVSEKAKTPDEIWEQATKNRFPVG